jgi:hypothetical protein
MPPPAFTATATLSPHGSFEPASWVGQSRTGVMPAQSSCPSGGMCMTRDGAVICDCPAGQTCRPRRFPPICRTDPFRCFFIPFPLCLLPVCSDPIQTADSYCQPG